MQLAVTRSKAEASILKAAKHDVVTGKSICSPRCEFTFEDTPAARELLQKYTLGHRLPLPQKSVYKAFLELTAECRRLREGHI